MNPKQWTLSKVDEFLCISSMMSLLVHQILFYFSFKFKHCWFLPCWFTYSIPTTHFKPIKFWNMYLKLNFTFPQLRVISRDFLLLFGKMRMGTHGSCLSPQRCFSCTFHYQGWYFSVICTEWLEVEK